MHLAAENHVDRSVTGPAAFIETNIVGTYVLLGWRKYWSALGEDKNNFRFHHISTDESLRRFTAHPDEVENTALRCRYLLKHATAYAGSPIASKSIQHDHLVRAAAYYGLPTIVTSGFLITMALITSLKLIPLINF